MTVYELKSALSEHDDNKEVYTISETGQYIPVELYFSDEQVMVGRNIDTLVDGVVMY